MCLILFAYNAHEQYPLVVAANRDEFFNRPTAPLEFWEDHNEILAGRDLDKGGTWMGINKNGKIAMVTNYRDMSRLKVEALSRGDLVAGFLKSQDESEAYLNNLQPSVNQYNDFNLVIGEGGKLWYVSSLRPEPELIEAGIHGLSNKILDTPWPKVQEGKLFLKNIINQSDPDFNDLFNFLDVKSTYPEEQLPDTGVGTEWEKVLSAAFIASPEYGTRCSTLLVVDKSGNVTMKERTYNNGGDAFTEQEYQLKWPEEF